MGFEALMVRVGADLSGLSAELSRASGKVKQFSANQARNFKTMGTAIDGASGRIGAFTKAQGANMRQLGMAAGIMLLKQRTIEENSTRQRLRS